MDEDKVRAERKKRKAVEPATIDLVATEAPSDQPRDEGSPTMSPPAAAVEEAPSQPAAEEPPPHTIPPADEAASTHPVEPPPPPLFEEPPPPRQPSALPLAVAALIGGVVGGAIVLATALAGVLPGFRASDDSLAPRLVAIEQELASARQQIDAAASRAGNAETAARAASDSATNAVNLAAEARDVASKAPSAPPDTAMADRLAKLEAATAELGAAITPLGDRATAAASAASEAASKASEAASTATEAQTTLAVTDRRIGALEKSVTAAPDRNAAYAVALGQLADAVRAGRPFEAELKAVNATGGNPAALAPLAALAGKGVPSIGDLARSFETAAPAIIAALTPADAPPPSAGVADRLWANLAKVVSVTREGEGEPSDPDEPVRAIRAALGQGDLATAIERFDALPEAARQAGAAWHAEARSTLDAVNLTHAETVAALQKLSTE